MKTLNQIADDLKKDLEKLGVSAYIFAASDPDSDCFDYNMGLDTFWQRGVIRTLDEMLSRTLAESFKEQDGDDEGWKKGN